MRGKAARPGPRRMLVGLARWIAAAAAIAPLTLGGCQDMGVGSAAPRLAPGIAIAVDTIDGPPAPIQAALTRAFSGAAATHKIMLVDDTQSPRFKLKGYLTATATSDGRTSLAYVWDLFDAGNQRAQRITGSDIVAGDAADPWAPVDDKVLRQVADASMDGIADFLAGAGPADAPAMAVATPAPALTRRQIVAGADADAPAGGPLGYAARE